MLEVASNLNRCFELLPGVLVMHRFIACCQFGVSLVMQAPELLHVLSRQPFLSLSPSLLLLPQLRKTVQLEPSFIAKCVSYKLYHLCIYSVERWDMYSDQLLEFRLNYANLS